MAITNKDSGTNVYEIAEGIYRVNTPVAVEGGPGAFSFNQYLIVDSADLKTSSDSVPVANSSRATVCTISSALSVNFGCSPALMASIVARSTPALSAIAACALQG